MGLLECVAVYKSLLNKKFILTLESDIKIDIVFSVKNFKHLLGLQKIKDYDLANNSSHTIYNLIKLRKFTDEALKKSSDYKKIADRILYFYLIPELLGSEIVVDFDKSKIPSDKFDSKLKNTEYILYKHIDDIKVAHLCLAHNTKESATYYPETFFVEPSNAYLSGQDLLNVLNVEVIDYKSNDK